METVCWALNTTPCVPSTSTVPLKLEIWTPAAPCTCALPESACSVALP